MNEVFNLLASEYDEIFTTSEIGKLQRSQVWDYLDKQAFVNLEILEINCGTGEDALLFTNSGNKVLATDYSTEMILECQKRNKNKSNLNVDFKLLDIKNINSIKPRKFDLIFSNFGGLNCLNPEEISTFLQSIPSLLNNNGRFIAVVMPKYSLMESLYFMLSLNFNKVFRRWVKGPLMFEFNEMSMPIWYYNPRFLIKQLRKSGELKGLKAIGLFVPPSYLEKKLKDKRKLLKFLQKADQVFSRIPLTSPLSDHYLIDFSFKK